MKSKLPIIGILLIFIAGLGVLCYPLISSVVNNIANRSGAEEYQSIVSSMSDDYTDEMFEKAEIYNNSLTNNVIITDPFDVEAYEKIGEFYQDSLNVNGQGLICYVDIPKINVYLPVYHGTSAEVLDHSAGHLQNTSLPIGGESTHSIISAHSAYPGETFFDYLTDLELGDEFYIHVLDRTLKYKVDQIKVVLPENTSDLRITRGEDHVTLLTCTPYSINSHRLLVRGVRVENDDLSLNTGATALRIDDSFLFFLGYKIPYWVAGSVIAGIIVVVVVLVIIASKKRKTAKHIAKDKPENLAFADSGSEDGD